MNDLTLFNDMFDDMIDDGFMMPSFSYRKVLPRVDVKEEKDSYELDMDLPGKTEKDVDIELKNNVLTVSSVKQTEKEEKKDDKKDKKENGKWIIKERTYSQFSRSFTLPEDVESSKISASVKDGVLCIKMPRKALAEAKKIAITCA